MLEDIEAISIPTPSRWTGSFAIGVGWTLYFYFPPYSPIPATLGPFPGLRSAQQQYGDLASTSRREIPEVNDEFPFRHLLP